jgi:cell division protein FtsW
MARAATTGRTAAGGAGAGGAAGRAAGAGTAERARTKAPTRRVPPPLEHRMLMTAALCLLAFGAVMVYSASSPLGVLGGHGGSGTGQFLRYLIFGAVGLLAMYVLERRGLELLDRRMSKLLLLGSAGLLLLVLVPGFGVSILGARRWFAAGPIQFQPSELMKLALILYVAAYLADHPRRMRSFRQAIAPIAVVVGPACLLIAVEPDLGTTLVVAFSVGALLIASGMPMRYLALLAGVVLVVGALFVLAQPYQQARLTSFLHPWSSKSTAGFQAVQGQIALGSGGLIGVGLGHSVQKIFYLPEAQTDFILAVIGEELGVLGIFGVVFLYGMIAYAGLRTARRAATRYAKLLATGLTSLILCQGILNIFVVLGLAPLTGVPLPFISYAPTNLCVMLASVGLLLNISRPGARRLKMVDPKRTTRRAPAAGDGVTDRDRRRRDRRTRRAGAGGR